MDKKKKFRGIKKFEKQLLVALIDLYDYRGVLYAITAQDLEFDITKITANYDYDHRILLEEYIIDYFANEFAK